MSARFTLALFTLSVFVSVDGVGQVTSSGNRVSDIIFDDITEEERKEIEGLFENSEPSDGRAGPFKGLPEWSLKLVTSDVQQRIVELQPNGSIDTPEELVEAWPAPAMEENAAVAYMEVPSWSKRKENPDLTFDQLVEASERKAFRYPFNWEEAVYDWLEFMMSPVNMEMGTKLRAHVRFAQHECFEALDDGRAADAVEAAAVSLRIVEHLNQQPTILAQLTKFACVDMTVLAVDAVLERGEIDANHARALMEACAAANGPYAVPRAIIGEYVIFGDPYSAGIIDLYDAHRRSSLRTRQLAAAIKALHADMGHWAEDYEYLVPEYLSAVPMNPFTGKPIPFERDERMYTFTLQPEGSTARWPENVVIAFAAASGGRVSE